MKKWRTERFNILAKVTQLVREGIGFQPGMKRELNEEQWQGNERLSSRVKICLRSKKKADSKW